MLPACSSAVEPGLGLPAGDSTSDSLVVVFGGTVVPIDGSGALEAHSVLVRDGRIADVAPSTELGAPAGSRVVDARGARVLPGLIDMDVHIDAEHLDDYVCHGVTTVRNMWGSVSG